MRYAHIYRALWREAIDVMDKVGDWCVNNCHNGVTGPALNVIYRLFPKHLKLMPTRRASLLVNLNRRDSNNLAQPSDDGGKRPLRLNILAPTLRTLHFSRHVSNNHGSTSLAG